MFVNKYWERRAGGQAPGYAVPADGNIPMGGLGWLGSSGDHLLRTYYSPLLSVHVQPTGGPPPLWWAEAAVFATAWWTDATDTNFYQYDSDFDGLLVAERLEMAQFVDPVNAGNYVVQWRPAAGTFSCATKRNPQGGVTSPVVNFGISVADPSLGIIANLWAGTKVTAWDFEETLWGTP